jgi:hypothetical protein
MRLVGDDRHLSDDFSDDFPNLVLWLAGGVFGLGCSRLLFGSPGRLRLRRLRLWLRLLFGSPGLRLRLRLWLRRLRLWLGLRLRLGLGLGLGLRIHLFV